MDTNETSEHCKIPLKELSQIKDEQEFQKEFEKIAMELSHVMYTLKRIGK